MKRKKTGEELLVPGLMLVEQDQSMDQDDFLQTLSFSRMLVIALGMGFQCLWVRLFVLIFSVLIKRTTANRNHQAVVKSPLPHA